MKSPLGGLFFSLLSGLIDHVWGSTNLLLGLEREPRFEWLTTIIMDRLGGDVPGVIWMDGWGLVVQDEAVFEAWCLAMRREWTEEVLAGGGLMGMTDE